MKYTACEAVQKGLSDLQIFDYIIGHADRNTGNWMYVKVGNTIIGVVGIDNDDTFGERWSAMTPGRSVQFTSKTPGIPPIVDISTALSKWNADFEAIRPLLAGLSGEEIAKAAERFAQVQQEVVQRARDGQIASIGDVGDQAKLQQLQVKVPDMRPNISRWGNDTAGDHNKQNSYLGYMIGQIDLIAQEYGGRGVVKESGLAFY